MLATGNWRRKFMPWFFIIWAVPAILVGGGIYLIQHACQAR